jgi:transcriptional regulator with XRE-family HTH domain
MPWERSSGKVLTGEDFKIFRTSRGLTQQELGDWLGITKQAVQMYEKRGVDRLQALALAALDRGLKPWKPTREDRKQPIAPREDPDGEYPY